MIFTALMTCFVLGFSLAVVSQEIPVNPVEPALIPESSPAEILSKESEVKTTLSIDPELQDPPTETEGVPTDPDELLRGKVTSFFESEDAVDWVRALTLLGARLERENAPEWINPLLLALLTDKALENPSRTRTILSDELITNSNTGILILTVLLRQEANWPFLEEVERSFRKWALDETVRDRLITEFRVASDVLLIRRLFDVLTVGDPRDVVEAAIDRLRSTEDGSSEVVLKSLNEFMKLDLGREKWVEWWKENNTKPIFEGIVSRTEEAGRSKELATWSRADRHLREAGLPQRYLAWLLESMDVSETISIRSAAIVRSGQFARDLMRAESATSPAERTELLKPALDRLVLILNGDVNASKRSGDFQDLALLCLAALREFSDFESESNLVNVLKFHIARLNPNLRNGARRLAREALETASALRSPVVEDIDAALERFLPGIDEVADEGELRRLVLAARTVGFSPDTVELLFRVAQVSPELDELVLEALVFGQVPQNSISRVLEYYGLLMESRKESNVRSLAINGIGRLGVPEGIPLLVSMVLKETAESVAERNAALAMIGSIGGQGAINGCMEVLSGLPETSELYKLALQQTLSLISADQSLIFAELFVLNESGEFRSWGTDALRSEDLISVLRAKGQPTDLRERDPLKFHRWVRLQAKRFEILVGDLVQRAPNATDEWNPLRQELVDSLSLLGDSPFTDDVQIPASRLLQLARELDGRTVVSEAIVGGTVTRVVDTFTIYLEAASNTGGIEAGNSYFPRDPWTWLLDRLDASRPGSGDIVLVRALRVLAEGRSERDNILERIDALEARSEPIKEKTPSPSPEEKPQEEPIRE